MTEGQFKSFIISLLRKGTYKWRPRNEALKLAKVGQDGRAFLYKCSHCGGIFKRKEIQIDHIDPVVDLDKGFTTWDEYIARMFCDISGFQILCTGCHDMKTQLEREYRKDIKKGIDID